MTRENSAHAVSDDRIEALLQEQEQQEALDGPRVPFKWYDSVALALFVGLFAVVFLQFFTRYVLNDSIAWTEEAARYLLICLAFVGSIKCQLLDSHIRLEVVDQMMPRLVKPLKIFSLVAVAGFGAFAAWSIWQLIARTSYQQMISLPFPKYYLYAVVLAAIGIFCLVCAGQLIALVKGDKK
ncbi:TRAP-type C4-dicarboxylate transport system permease small subunit [Pacificibacter maritimus]|uniref:TRAP transporter small permease protein n=1 Tax=Pacificibacter maritimus TaxID=762213 RepID=A0A3N4TWM5_9RHOB|nr:TRAP transporter small permease [Pacificibacter maritimus]RPE62953.1 TRAP-type C4-dicarboxylate transport system permease small subunit [Pacificibacter maritimus]